MSIIRRALISTADKTGLIDFAKQLHANGITILATGQTARLLKEQQLPVTEVAEYTGFPEIMDGRVKTLHPKIHAGLLSRAGIDDAVLKKQEIEPIDLLVVNLYPFQQTIAKKDCTLEQAIEQIDIGGPTMIRAAAKNHQRVTVVIDPNDYELILNEIRQTGQTDQQTRYRLAVKAFAHTATYDQAITNYLNQSSRQKEESAIFFPEHLQLNFYKKMDLRYGENPHQAAALYTLSLNKDQSLAHAECLQGKPLSYNNLLDSEAALNCVSVLDTNQYACAIIKHTIPCGVAQADNLVNAYRRAYQTDPTSAFGGVIAFNQIVDEQTAQTILDQQFVEIIIAPTFSKEALALFKQKNNLRIISCKINAENKRNMILHSISGGLLIQQNDYLGLKEDQLTIVTQRKPTNHEWLDLLFAWHIVKFIKSNAIIYAKDQATLGIGSGQTSRSFSAQIALLRAQQAQLSTQNSVMASDAFLPFADSIEIAAQAGITALIQPGGSIRDNEVIQAADQAQMAMVFTGIRHFRH